MEVVLVEVNFVVVVVVVLVVAAAQKPVATLQTCRTESLSQAVTSRGAGAGQCPSLPTRRMGSHKLRSSDLDDARLSRGFTKHRLIGQSGGEME
jgi:hypothetical protein